MQLHPHHLPLLLHLTSCLGEAAAASALAAAAAAREASVAAADAPAAEPAPAARSIIEGMLLPDTTAFATEFISQSWGYGRASAHASDSQVEASFLTFLAISFSTLPMCPTVPPIAFHLVLDLLCKRSGHRARG